MNAINVLVVDTEAFTVYALWSMTLCMLFDLALYECFTEIA